MGPNQSTPSGQDRLPCLGILIPQPLLEECALLRDEFDELPMGVSMEADKLNRLNYLLNLNRLPLDETLRDEYRQRVEMALKFRRDYEFLREWLLTNGDNDLENGTLEAIERQRKYFGPNDKTLERAIRQSLNARRSAAAGEPLSAESGAGRSQESEGTALSTMRRRARSVATGRRRGSSRWRKTSPKVNSDLETVQEASGEDDNEGR